MANPFKKTEKITDAELALLKQAGINLDLAAGAYNSVLGQLSQKYKLVEGDNLKDGVIVRKPAEK